MNIDDVDLNLLRLLVALDQVRSVSRAAQVLGISQPTASQALSRLRVLLNDPLFVRAPGGVKPTRRAERLAATVRAALGDIETALNEPARFDPLTSRRVFRLRMSDIGEGSFLPRLMTALGERAPHVAIETMPLPTDDIAAMLDGGQLDFALGFLPDLRAVQQVRLLTDRYIVLVRKGHPITRRPSGASTAEGAEISLEELKGLQFVAVRTHQATLRILQLIDASERVRLTAENFMALPTIVKATDMAVVMPWIIAKHYFAQDDGYTIIDTPLPLREMVVSLYWSKRHAADPASIWLRELMIELYSVR